MNKKAKAEAKRARRSKQKEGGEASDPLKPTDLEPTDLEPTDVEPETTDESD